jgi:hypothetical protein
MRPIACLLALITAAGLAADGKPPDMDSLVARLASRDFREREAAARSLERIGEQAIGPLRRATGQADPETRRRAAELIERIDRRSVADHILAPLFVDLDYRKTPLTAAVADLSRCTGLPLLLYGEPATFANRTVTLAADRVTSWQAIRLLCAQAGLHEADHRTPTAPPMPFGSDEPRKPNEGMLVLGQMLARRGQQSPITVVVPATQIELLNGSSHELPSHHAGSVRIRAAPAGLQQGDAKTYMIILLIAGEPRLHLEGPSDLRVERAVDDRGRELKAHAVWPSPPEERDDWPRGRQPAVVTNRRRGPVGVGLEIGADPPPKRLRELAGVLTLTTYPGEQVVALSRPGESEGKTARSGDVAFTLKEFSRHVGDEVRVTAEVQMPYGNHVDCPLGVARWQRRWAGGGGGQFGQFDFEPEESRVSGADYQGLALSDIAGRQLEAVGGQAQITGLFPQWYTLRITAVFRAPVAKPEPDRVTLSVRRPVTVDVPFVLRDVAMP